MAAKTKTTTKKASTKKADSSDLAVRKTTTKTRTKKAARTPKNIVEENELVTSSETSSDSTRKAPFKLSKSFVIPVLLLLAVLGVVYLGSKYFVMAWVDKKPVTRLEYYRALDQRYGQEMREQIIAEKLIKSEAQNKGVNVTDDEVNAEVAKLEQQRGGAEQLEQLLQMQGLNRDDLNKLVELQIMKEKIFGQGYVVSDEELNAYVEQNKDQLPDTSDETKNQIREELRQQAINATFSSWLQEALQSNRVTRN